ncbi:hypothetical protein [Pusillimonas sp.]|uniref:hypothetical protein n=1 Tax=Pusillimonas sp. TaxID=3040095 RepID=UPI0037C7F31B
MTQSDPPSAFNESGFELLASAIDRIDPEQRDVFLCKLAILLASHAGPDVLSACIPKAERHLRPVSAT